MPVDHHHASEPFFLYLLFLAVIALSLPALGPALAGGPPPVELTVEERAWLDQHPEKLSLFFNVEFPPIEFAASAGTFAGMGADVIALVEGCLRKVFSKVPSADWNRHLSALKTGECAVAPTIVRTEERERYAFFTTPYATVPVVIITTRGAGHGRTLDDLDGRRVAVVSGFATERYLLDRARGRFEVVPIPDVPHGLQAVSFGQVDAFVENLAVAAYYIDQGGIPNLRVAGRTDYAFAFSIGVSRKYPLLYSAVQKALAAIPETELEAIRKKWISLQVQSGLAPETKRLLVLAAAFTVLLILGLISISYFLKRRLKEKVDSLRTAQQELAHSEARFRAIFDHAPYAIVINSLEDGRFLEANKAFLDSRDVNKDDMTQLRSTDLSLIGGAELKTISEVLMKDGSIRNREAHILNKDGTHSHVMYSSVLLELQGCKQILSMTVDVTEKKKAEQALLESEARFRSLFTMAPLPLVEVTGYGKIIEVNERFIQTMGYGMKDIASVEHLLGLLCPDRTYRSRVKSDWRTAVDQQLQSGSVIKPGEYQVTSRDGTVRTMLIGASMIGENFLVSFVDITERKRSEDERRKLQEQLLQAQKLEAVGILAGGIAHDFNNMLGAIIGYTELVLDRMAPADPARVDLGKIRDVAHRSANLTRQLLAFARKQTVEPVAFDLNESVEALLTMLRRLIGEDIELAWLPGTGRCTVYMDPTQLDQTLTNLCVNARDAIADVGTITISTATLSLDQTTCATYGDAVPGEYVLLAVSDNGCGMDEETVDHLFEPFFTTKAVGQGSGLGLAMVYGIVKQNHGFIHLESRPGQGTTFHILLPHHPGLPMQQSAAPPDHIPESQGETILLVEDDPTLREMGEMMLLRLGYVVLSAATPGEAIRLVEDGHPDIHLFITDVVMPEMNGGELADRLLSIRPSMKHIFMSGYTADVIVPRGVSNVGGNFIQKPFTMRDLAVKVRALLDHA